MKRLTLLTVAIVVVFGLTVAACDDSADLRAERDDALERVAELEDREPETVTEEVEVKVTPAVCLDALDDGDEAFGIVNDFLEAVLDWFDTPAGSAAEAETEARMDEAYDALSALIPEYEADAEACRAS